MSIRKQGKNSEGKNYVYLKQIKDRTINAEV